MIGGRRRFLMVGAATAILLAACSDPSEKARPVEASLRVQLKWTHNAQFAGFYLAQSAGAFAREGLDVALVEGGPTVDVIDEVRAGKADLGIAGAEDLLAAVHAQPDLVALAVIFRVNPFVLVVHDDSNIRSPRDLPGRSIAFPGRDGRTQVELMMNRFNRGKPALREVPFDREYAHFLQREVEVVGAYATGGLIRLQDAGASVRAMWPASYGLNWYGDVIFGRRGETAARQASIGRFLAATEKGWQLALADPDAGAAGAALHSGRPAAMERRALVAARPLIVSGLEPFGVMRAADWLDMQQQMREAGLIGAADRVAALFSPVSLMMTP